MNYVIKSVDEVSQAQWNASVNGRIKNVRMNQDANKCVLKFEDSMKPYFMDEVILTHYEVAEALSADEWQITEEEMPGFLQRFLEFFGLG